MSKMSTKIEDLPGGPIEEVIVPNQQERDETINEIDISKYNDNKSNVHANIKKTETKNEMSKSSSQNSSFLSQLRREINEENTLLFVIFALFMTNRFNNYMNVIPGFDKIAKNEWSLVLVKSGVAVLMFVILKKFVLSKFNL